MYGCCFFASSSWLSLISMSLRFFVEITRIVEPVASTIVSYGWNVIINSWLSFYWCSITISTLHFTYKNHANHFYLVFFINNIIHGRRKNTFFIVYVSFLLIFVAIYCAGCNERELHSVYTLLNAMRLQMFKNIFIHLQQLEKSHENTM